MRWPAQSTHWMRDLVAAQELAGSELAGTSLRLAGLEGLTSTNPGPVGGAAKGAIEAGRAALAGQTGERAGSGGAVKGCEQGAHTPATPTVMPPQTYRTCPVTKPLRASSR